MAKADNHDAGIVGITGPQGREFRRFRASEHALMLAWIAQHRTAGHTIDGITYLPLAQHGFTEAERAEHEAATR